jgi:glycosyltransferase involved in cell wall biosynthesis
MLPVFFFQPSTSLRELMTEETDVSGVEIVHYPVRNPSAALEEALALLRSRGIRRPLLWVYNFVNYVDLIKANQDAFIVFHATEDLVTPSAVSGIDTVGLRAPLMDQLAVTDLLVAVSDAVADAYCRVAGYRGASLVAANGCDADFIESVRENLERRQQRPSHQVAVYQGGINYRIDFKLLIQLAQSLPEWTFVFCGRADETLEGWRELTALENVRYLGQLDAHGVAETMCSGSVGLIPFKQDPIIRNSLPLKAFEYVAAGLPVVSVPIDALSAHPDLFRVANTPDEFARGVIAASRSRFDAAALVARRAAARHNSYDARFTEVCEAIAATYQELKRPGRRLNLCVVYGSASSVREFAEQFVREFAAASHHRVVFAPLGRVSNESLWAFDAIVFHDSVAPTTSLDASEFPHDAFAALSGARVLAVSRSECGIDDAICLATCLDCRAILMTKGDRLGQIIELGASCSTTGGRPSLQREASAVPDVRNTAKMTRLVQGFAPALDELVDGLVLKGPKHEIVLKPIMARTAGGPSGQGWRHFGGDLLLALAGAPRSAFLTDSVEAVAKYVGLRAAIRRKQAVAIARIRMRTRRGSRIGRFLKAIWLALPVRLRDRVYSSIRGR